MQFEYLIWIMIILVYVVFSVILKRVRAVLKAGGEGAVKKRPEWKEKLEAFLSKARQELKVTRQEGLKKETGWEKLLPREDDELILTRRQISPERPKRDLEKPPSPKIKPAPVKTLVESVEPAVSGKKSLSKDLEYEIQDLRKAVIWSEILAPPLALRDD
jgi:hypothetical protein